MTTIIVDMKNKTIYSDRQRTSTMESNVAGIFEGSDFRNATIYHEDVPKIYQHNGIIMAGTGNADIITEAWNNSFLNRDPLYKLSADKVRNEKTTIVTLIGNKESAKVCVYTLKKNVKFFTRKVWYEWVVDIIPAVEGYLYFGSGVDYAEGAMNTGLVTPKEAIIAASKCDPYTDANVDEVSL